MIQCKWKQGASLQNFSKKTIFPLRKNFKNQETTAVADYNLCL